MHVSFDLHSVGTRVGPLSAKHINILFQCLKFHRRRCWECWVCDQPLSCARTTVRMCAGRMCVSMYAHDIFGGVKQLHDRLTAEIKKCVWCTKVNSN